VAAVTIGTDVELAAGIAAGAAVTDRSAAPRLTGRQKAAVLLVSLGSQNAAEVLGHLSDREVEAISAEIAGLKKVRPETSAAVMQELAETVLARDQVSVGGIDYAREVLEQLLGSSRADEIIGALVAQNELRPFDFLRRTPPDQIAAFLTDEAPQIVSLVVAHLPPSVASRVLAEMPGERQGDIAFRIARMTETNPDVVRDVERGLRQKLSNVLNQEFKAVGGVDALADLLNQAGRSTERNVLGVVAEMDSELAEEIRQRLFTFEDIVELSDRDIQLILREVDNKDLTLALRGVPDPVRDRLLSNMSQRAAATLHEDLDAMPPQKRHVVEEAQSKIVGVVRKLEEAGILTLSPGDAEEEV
jgi:flagellar motor switch protein FliG